MSLKIFKSPNLVDFNHRASQMRILHKNYQHLQNLGFFWGKYFFSIKSPAFFTTPKRRLCFWIVFQMVFSPNNHQKVQKLEFFGKIHVFFLKKILGNG